jgi:hypothetical protein
MVERFSRPYTSKTLTAMTPVVPLWMPRGRLRPPEECMLLVVDETRPDNYTREELPDE